LAGYPAVFNSWYGIRPDTGYQKGQIIAAGQISSASLLNRVVDPDGFNADPDPAF
jgi:hypothetical protein